MLLITVSLLLFLMSFCLGLVRLHPLKQRDILMKLYLCSNTSGHWVATVCLHTSCNCGRNTELKPDLFSNRQENKHYLEEMKHKNGAKKESKDSYEENERS